MSPQVLLPIAAPALVASAAMRIAARMRWYVPQRQTLVIASSISASVGFGFLPSSAAAAMIWPDWQYPHCGTSSASHAFCTGWSPAADKPSMVTILSVGSTALTGIEQERCTSPLMCTEHAPHCAIPQPYFVPVSPTCSRRTQSKGISSSTFTSMTSPLTLSFVTHNTPRCGVRAPADTVTALRSRHVFTADYDSQEKPPFTIPRSDLG